MFKNDDTDISFVVSGLQGDRKTKSKERGKKDVIFYGFNQYLTERKNRFDGLIFGLIDWHAEKQSLCIHTLLGYKLFFLYLDFKF